MDNKNYLKKILSAGIHVADKAKLEESLNELPPSSDNKPHQQLVTNEKGEQIWEDKLVYSWNEEKILITERTQKGGYLNPAPVETAIIGNSYIIVCDGVEYNCICQEHEAFLNCIGNNFLTSNNIEDDTGEPFWIGSINSGMSSFILFLDQSVSHTIMMKGIETQYQSIFGRYVAGGISEGEGAYSHVFNNQRAENASGVRSAAFNLSYALGNDSFSANSGIARGFLSFAQNESQASGRSSHSEGDSLAKGDYSHSEGSGTIATGLHQHAQGKFNIEDTENKYSHIVGNGEFNAPSNAHTLDWHGNAWYAGTVEGTGIILKSSTENSEKRFLIKVDDSGALTATEIVE